MRAGLTEIFTLSGNHIMPIFDAAIGTRLRLTHVRHEAAAVHMADAWGRLSGMPGIALVTGGQGHTNAVAALATAQAAESPLILLSGHAGLDEIGRGAFQELRQAEIAAPVVQSIVDGRALPKASVTTLRAPCALRAKAGRGRCMSACPSICWRRRSRIAQRSGRAMRNSSRR